MRGPESIRHQPPFPGVIPEPGAGCPRVTHPFAAPYQGGLPLQGRSLDLHVLSTPPAFVLSQDQTLRRDVRSRPDAACVRTDSFVYVRHPVPGTLKRPSPADGERTDLC